MIPHQIITFWHQQKLPWLAEQCVKTMKQHNSKFDIEILSSKDVKRICEMKYEDYIDQLISRLDIGRLMKTQVSELVRLLCIYKKGGIWLDVHCICTKNLSEVFDMQSNDFQGWTTFQNAVDTWAFACDKHNSFLRCWICEFLIALANPTEYITYHYEEFTKSSHEGVYLMDKDHEYFLCYLSSIVARNHRYCTLKKAISSTQPLFYCENGYDSIFGECIPALLKLDSSSRLQIRLKMSDYLKKNKKMCPIVDILQIYEIKNWKKILKKCPKTKFN